jgi:glycine hydroxymethyltransferase
MVQVAGAFAARAIRSWSSSSPPGPRTKPIAVQANTTASTRPLVRPISLDDGQIAAAYTSKTLFGPARGILLVRESEEIHEKLTDVYRNFLIQSTYQLNGLVALTLALVETTEFGERFAAAVVANSRALARGLSEQGVEVLGMDQGGSRSHQVLPKVGWIPSAKTQALRDNLQKAGICCDGLLRFGTQQLTRLGVTEVEMDEVANFIASVLKFGDGERVRRDTEAFTDRHQTLQYCFDDNDEAFRYYWL